MYDHNGITVDDRFARFGAKSYAINKIGSGSLTHYHKITSIDVRWETEPGRPSKRGTWLVLAATRCC